MATALSNQMVPGKRIRSVSHSRKNFFAIVASTRGIELIRNMVNCLGCALYAFDNQAEVWRSYLGNIASSQESNPDGLRAIGLK